MRGMSHVTYKVQHVCPALHGHTLEDGEHGQADVVKVGDAIVGSLPTLVTSVVAVIRRNVLAAEAVTARLCIIHYLLCHRCHTQQLNKMHQII